MTAGTKLDRANWSKVQWGLSSPTSATPGWIYIRRNDGSLWVRTSTTSDWQVVMAYWGRNASGSPTYVYPRYNFDRVRAWNGTAAYPAYSFKNGAKSGWYLSDTTPAANVISLSLDGTKRWDFNGNNFIGNATHGAYIRGGGTINAHTPTYSFYDDNDTGIYSNTANYVEIASSGTRTAYFNTTGLYMINGTVIAPSYSFINSTDSGMSYSAGLGEDEVLISANATQLFSFRNTANTTTKVLRGTTSLWWHTEQIGIYECRAYGAATAPTATAADGDTNGGWQLDADDEYLYFQRHMMTDWDAASDLEVIVHWESAVDNSGGAGGDTVALDLAYWYKQKNEVATKTQTLTESVTVGTCAQWTQFSTTFTIDYNDADGAADTLEVEDNLHFRLNLNTIESEGAVDDIIVNSIQFRWKTAWMNCEV